jgi:predicted DNA-binding mobile mystery protein A
MKDDSNRLEQLNDKMLQFASLKQTTIPSEGWIKSIRKAIGMSMQQLGNKLHISKQAIWEIEKREPNGTLSIKSLCEIGEAMELQFVYGFIPKDGILEALIEKNIIEKSLKIKKERLKLL